MKRYRVLAFLMVLALGAGVLVWLRTSFSPSSQSHQETVPLYTCAMHPQIVRDKPGNCPICGMPLVLKTNEPTDLGVEITGSEEVRARVATVPVEERELRKTIRTVGLVAFDRELFVGDLISSLVAVLRS